MSRTKSQVDQSASMSDVLGGSGNQIESMLNMADKLMGLGNSPVLQQAKKAWTISVSGFSPHLMLCLP